MITLNHPETQNAILPTNEIPIAEPLLQVRTEMTAHEIVQEAIRRGFTPSHGNICRCWNSNDIYQAFQFLEAFEPDEN